VIKGGGVDNCDRDLNARHFGRRVFKRERKLDLLRRMCNHSFSWMMELFKRASL